MTAGLQARSILHTVFKDFQCANYARCLSCLCTVRVTGQGWRKLQVAQAAWDRPD